MNLWVPKLTTPARYHRPLRTAIKGPPESPEQESVADWPLAHSWLSSKVRELMPGPSLPLAAALLYSSWQAVLLIGCSPVNWRRGEEEALSVLPQPAMFLMMMEMMKTQNPLFTCPTCHNQLSRWICHKIRVWMMNTKRSDVIGQWNRPF